MIIVYNLRHIYLRYKFYEGTTHQKIKKATYNIIYLRDVMQILEKVAIKIDWTEASPVHFLFIHVVCAWGNRVRQGNIIYINVYYNKHKC